MQESFRDLFLAAEVQLTAVPAPFLPGSNAFRRNFCPKVLSVVFCDSFMQLFVIHFFKDDEGNDLPKTVISREYSSEWKPGDEPYYPVNDEKNGELYKKYRELADQEPNVIFGGRLGEYKYYDMDKTIEVALDNSRELIQE